MPSDVGEKARSMASELRRMGSGDLAAMRRGRVSEAPAWWRLVARCELPVTDDWAAIAQILAILTPKGPPEMRPPLHDAARPWGAVVCDGGDPGWRPEPAARQPRLLSERRFAQLLAARGEGRRVLMTRAARAVVAKRAAPGIDVESVAWALLAPDNPGGLAGPYYRRLDGPEKPPEADETETPEHA